MVLWIPLMLFGIGAVAVFVVCSRDDTSTGGLMVLLFSIMMVGPLSVIAYGGYIWLRKGYWGSISVEDLLTVVLGQGPALYSLRAHTSWEGVQKICDWYLESSVGWTAFLVPMAVLWLLLQVSEAADKRRREAKTPGAKR